MHFSKGLSGKMKNNPLSPDFWKAFSASFTEEQDVRFTSPEFWDRIAKTYDELETSPFYQEMVEEIIETMKRRGALSPENRIFDVACGPCNYAIRFAPFVKEVVALDISPKMVQKCKEKIKKTKIKNIRLILEDWFHFETSERFETVFVSMTPILQDLHSVDRLLAIAKRFLVIIHWAGVRQNLLHTRIWKEVFDKKLVCKKPGIIVVFNYLYTLGYAGDLRLFSGYWERKRPLEKELEHILWRLDGEGIRVDETAEKRILSILETESKDGIITSCTKVRIGFLFIDLSKRCLIGT